MVCLLHMKICRRCNINKDNSCYYNSKFNKDGLYSFCKQCHVVLTTRKRSRRNSCDYTKRDILVSRWGYIHHRKDRCYKNIKVNMSRDEFFANLDNKDLDMLYSNWVKSGREYKLKPTIDRIDPKRDYELSNIRWLTHSENSRLSRITN